MIDAIHHAANMARVHSLEAAREMLAGTLVDQEPRFFAALEAVLDAAASGSDFEALYNLARLAYGDQIDKPEQLKLWRDD